MTRYRITTPEQVDFHYVLAGPISRALAWLLDQIIIWACYIVVIYTFAQLNNELGVALIILGMFIIDFSYFVFFELYWSGQSPGKRKFGIRVISARGSRLQFNDVLIRNLLRPVDLLPIGMVVGGAIAMIDPCRRRLGDLVAGTIVVRDSLQSLPQLLASEKNRVNTFQSDPATRNRILTRVTRRQRDFIMDLALRRDQIKPAVREQLFGRAADHLRATLGLPPDLDHLSDEQTVINLALILQEAKFTA